MKLYYNTTSPYSRKVRMVIIEKGLADQVELCLCNPFENVDVVSQHNPLGKVPALILDDGEVLFDSPVICEYLDSFSGTANLIPQESDVRWQVLRWQALADGIIDQSYNIVMERRRPLEQQSSYWLQRWMQSIKQAMSYAEQEITTMSKEINLGHLSLMAALAYLDLRIEHYDWREACSDLADFYTQLAQRESVLTTSAM